ncbi:MAG: hypothetical protein ACI4V7_09160 [Succinivibrionaceae bacterium]
MNGEFAITTLDNPYDPFTQFEDWFLFDVEKGYNSCSVLARIAQITDDMSENEKDVEIERAIDRIIQLDFTNMRKKVRRTDDVAQ